MADKRVGGRGGSSGGGKGPVGGRGRGPGGGGAHGGGRGPSTQGPRGGRGPAQGGRGGEGGGYSTQGGRGRSEGEAGKRAFPGPARQGGAGAGREPSGRPYRGGERDRSFSGPAGQGGGPSDRPYKRGERDHKYPGPARQGGTGPRREGGEGGYREGRSGEGYAPRWEDFKDVPIGKGPRGPRQPLYMKKGGHPGKPEYGAPGRPEGGRPEGVRPGRPARPEGGRPGRPAPSGERGRAGEYKGAPARPAQQRPERGRAGEFRAEPGRPAPQGDRGRAAPGRPAQQRPERGRAGEFRTESGRPAQHRPDRGAAGEFPRPSPRRPAPGPRAPEPAEGFSRLKEEILEAFEGFEDRVGGINPVLELLRSQSRPVDAILVDKEKGGKIFGEIISAARQSGITVKIVPSQALDSAAPGVRHQGVVAMVSPKAYADPYGLAEAALAKGKAPLLVILDGVEDPHNLGAIIRTAEASGADGVIIPEHRSAHLSATVAKASAGALEHLPVAKVPNLVNYLASLKEKGYWIVGLAGDAGDDYTAFDMSVPLAVVMGGEGEGIRPVVRKACDKLLALPMLGKVSSLNVSVAAGVVLYEVVRQRKQKA